MSTNYYIKDYPADEDMDPKWHIGKVWGMGKGKIGFMWAMHPNNLKKRLFDEDYNSDLGGIVDEYGREFNLPSFLRDVLGNCEVVVDKHIGEKFC